VIAEPDLNKPLSDIKLLSIRQSLTEATCPTFRLALTERDDPSEQLLKIEVLPLITTDPVVDMLSPVRRLPNIEKPEPIL